MIGPGQGRPRQVLAQHLGRAHRVGDFHRIFSFAFFRRNLKIDAVVVASADGQPRSSPAPNGYTTPVDVNRLVLWLTNRMKTVTLRYHSKCPEDLAAIAESKSEIVPNVQFFGKTAFTIENAPIPKSIGDSIGLEKTITVQMKVRLDKADKADD